MLDKPGPGRVHALLSRLPQHAICGAEIGVHRGLMAQYLLHRHSLMHLYLIDRWCVPNDGGQYLRSGDRKATLSESQHTQAYMAALKATEFAKERRTVIKDESISAARLVADNHLDFIFIDADHSYDGVKSDLAAWVPKVKVGGLISGHDYAAGWGVVKAVDEWISTIGGVLELDIDHTWFVRKL